MNILTEKRGRNADGGTTALRGFGRRAIRFTRNWIMNVIGKRMKLRYEIIPEDRTFSVTAPSGRKHFESPATDKKKSKIYVLLDGAEILYVGQTGQSIRSRFRGAFQANGETGFYGYKWRDKRKKLTLLIWILPDFVATFEGREAVEAEVIFRVRRDFGYWPRYQNEVHFWNTDEKILTLADEIFDELKKEPNASTQAQ